MVAWRELIYVGGQDIMTDQWMWSLKSPLID